MRADLMERSRWGADHRGIGSYVVSGTRYGVIPGGSSVTHENLVLASTGLFAAPMFLRRRMLLSGFRAGCTATAASKTVWIGLYKTLEHSTSTADAGIPGALIAQGSFTTDATGVKTVTLATPVVVEPGQLWAAWSSDGTGSLMFTYYTIPSAPINIHEANSLGLYNISRVFTPGTLPTPWGTPTTFTTHANSCLRTPFGLLTVAI